MNRPLPGRAAPPVQQDRATRRLPAGAAQASPARMAISAGTMTVPVARAGRPQEETGRQRPLIAGAAWTPRHPWPLATNVALAAVADGGQSSSFREAGE